jgi:hypothetical protein
VLGCELRKRRDDLGMLHLGTYWYFDD